MNRLGRGYSFEALRAKILFSEGAQKRVKPKFERRAAPRMAIEFAMSRSFAVPDFDQHSSPAKEINYGADISTLTRMIESGQL